MFITLLLSAILVYALAGCCFLPFFYKKGIHLIDESVKGSSIGFYIIIIPGVLVFWPVLLRQWRKALKTKSNEQATA
ncbi:MAG: hypothetical protein KGZ74_12665 [Chitinophagaceae bacterium]|nr:hypothetical protein [Chitinophagaceae bacterium]